MRFVSAFLLVLFGLASSSDCPENHYGENCDVVNEHTETAVFTLTDIPSNIGEVEHPDMGKQVCSTMCPLYVDPDRSSKWVQDGPHRCARLWWGKMKYCLLCGASGLDLVDNNTGEAIKDYCETLTCEEGIRITDDHMNPEKGKGQVFGFDPVCADRFFQEQYGSKKWSGKGVDLIIDGTKMTRNKATQIWFWKAGKECDGKPCARLGRSVSKPGDFALGHMIGPNKLKYHYGCDTYLQITNNYPALYSKSGSYFSFNEDCMDQWYGSKDWGSKTVKGVSIYGEDKTKMNIIFFKNSKTFGGQSVARLSPKSKVKRNFWDVNMKLMINTDCVGEWSECDDTCVKTYTHLVKKKNKGKRCREDDGAQEICQDGACVNFCGCELQPNLVESVCGADGKTYRNSCAAECAGTTVVDQGPCTCVLIEEIEDEDDYNYDREHGTCESYRQYCQPGETCIDEQCFACPGVNYACETEENQLTEEECEDAFYEDEDGDDGNFRVVSTLEYPTGCYVLYKKRNRSRPYYKFNKHPKGGKRWGYDKYKAVCKGDESSSSVFTAVGISGSAASVKDNVIFGGLVVLMFGAGDYYSTLTRKKQAASTSF